MRSVRSAKESAHVGAEAHEIDRSAVAPPQGGTPTQSIALMSAACCDAASEYVNLDCSFRGAVFSNEAT
jgi:hypothetical protein